MAHALAFVWGCRAEIALSLALLGGWYAMSVGFASILGHRVWPFAIAALLFSCCGWKLLRQLAGDGLYALTRSPKTSANG